MKTYNEQSNIGKAKHIINYHDGVKKQSDNSNFFDIAIFKNKQDKNSFIVSLLKKGYKNA